ncbi:MAG TPA: non-ribosomal peptide synthase/polyketide synthase [Dictyobacter sp.]|nr:non-ribosomal peptide synthase/polyketide synthase [Dictyobacter sp.]
MIIQGPGNTWTTFVDILRWRATNQPDQRAYTFLTDGETTEISFTYAELDAQARHIAALLQEQVTSGSRALLLYQPGLEYVAAIFGCWYAGVIAIPAYPPRMNGNLGRIETIIQDAQASIALTTTNIHTSLHRKFSAEPLLQDLGWIETDNTIDTTAEYQELQAEENALALLQYTSGSTGTPKGVMLTHRNLMQNAALIQTGMELYTRADVIGSWLPPYHDMGLMGGILESMYIGSSSILMSPAAFLQRPLRWLQMISRYRVHGSGAPNFAFDLCVQSMRKATPEQLADLDLSSWRLAFSGSEPVRLETFERFYQTFAPYGLRKEALYPCYGLAEATLFVSGGEKTISPPVQYFDPAKLEVGRIVETSTTAAQRHPFISCGFAREGQRILIVDPEKQTTCTPNQVGEIWVAAPNIAQGYWNKPEETAYTFQAYLKESNEGPFLRTGDLGFMQDGELYVTGRLKDLIIIRGRNLYPHDIEAVVATCHPALRAGNAAAFAIAADDTERLVIVQEVERHYQQWDAQEIIQSIREGVAREFEVEVYAIELLRPGGILKTSSGKIRRRACREGFLQQTLTAVYRWTQHSDSTQSPSSTTRTLDSSSENENNTDEQPAPTHITTQDVLVWLKKQIAKRTRLHPDKIDLNQSIASFGLDSVTAISLTNDLATWSGHLIPPTLVYEVPTIETLAQAVIDGIASTDSNTPTEILPGTRDGEIPLSFAQERLWFLDQLTPLSTAYNIATAIQLTGPLSVAALEHSLAAIIRRHEILRTVFQEQQGEARSHILPTLNIELPIYDIYDNQTSANDRIARLMQEEAQTPFDLTHGPLLRASLLRRGEQDHILLFTIHHIIADGWSMGILMQELSTYYNAEINGPTANLPALPIQYADFAHWQRQWLQSKVIQEQLDYWQRQLADAPTLLELPTDRPRPAVQTAIGARQSIHLSVELAQELKNLSKREGVTLFMTLLAAFQVLLMRHSGQEDIIVGTPIANRTREEVKGLIGFFVNTLALRGDLSGNPTFQQLLMQVHDRALDAYRHQDLPFEHVVDALHIERSLSYSPLVQVLFTLQNFPLATLDLTGLAWQQLEIAQAMVKFDLSVTLTEHYDELITEIEYNTDLFAAATIERLLEHWIILLEGIVAQPEQPIATLPLLAPHEQGELLVDWQATTTDEPAQLIHELIATQATATPDTVAITFEDQQLTYQELDQRADQLAATLHAADIRPDVLVGVCLERSLEMIISLLAVLKAGGAYVPLDPDFPAQRLEYIMQDAQIALILSHTTLDDKLPVTTIPVLFVDTEMAANRKLKGNIAKNLDRENLAYVIYTSGSTGFPKGAMNTHRGISNRLHWMQQTYQLQPHDRILQKTPYSFDVSVWEFFWPLLVGARLVIAQPRGHRDPGYLKTVIIEQHITTLHFVPTMLHVFLQEPGISSCASLRRLLCSGEALSAEVQARFFSLFTSQCHLFNLYGPTEAAIDVTAWECRAEEQASIVPIGHPISNTQIYLLDASLQPVPIGVAGELFIGGVNLARGYARRSDLTAERFLPHPFSAIPGARLYRTGDRARFRSDGTIEYLGRIDFQVKLRGFRIELGEIEECLRQQAGVLDAVVILHNAGEQQFLVAYLVPQADTNPQIQEIEAELHAQLPDYMVPHAFIMLERLPVTASGKVDRRALPLPDEQVLQHHQKQFVAPCTPQQEALAQIWQDVLHVSQIGIHDNFFALGGDSILSLQVITRARQAGIHLQPKQLFQHQSIAQLASIIADNPVSNTVEPEAVTVGPIPLIPIQRWFFERQLAQAHHFNQAVYLKLPVHWPIDLLQQALALVVQRHETLRSRFIPTEDGWLQQIQTLDAAEPSFIQIDLRDIPSHEQPQALTQIAQQTQASLNLQDGPLFRAVAFILHEQAPKRLLLVIHHLVVDGISWRVLLEDLHIAIQSLLCKQPALFPPMTASFAQWARHLQQQATASWLQEEIPYWQRTAQAVTLPVKLDRVIDSRMPQTEATTRQIQITLDVQSTHQLLHEAMRPYHSQIQELLLAAVLHALAGWIGSQHIRLDLEGHGREAIGEDEIDISRTVGWFTSLFPVLFTLPTREASWQEWIIAIKEQLRAVPHRGFGYGLLRYLHEDAQVRSSVQTTQPAPISFNYLGQFDQVLQREHEQSSAGQMQITPELSGTTQGPRNERSHLLAIDGLLSDGQLLLNWNYSSQHFEDATIQQLAQQVQQDLRDLVRHCLSPEAGKYTPSDFPLAQINQTTLDRVLADHPAKVVDLYPLTPMQQGLLFHTVSDPHSGVYIEQFWCVINQLDVKRFTQAWQTAIDQHPVLRTSFVWEGLAQPLQQVWTQARLPLHIEDWRTRRHTEQKQKLSDYLQTDRTQGFDPQQAPLMRLALIQLSEQQTQLVWTHHHLLLDGWSMAMLVQEVFNNYHLLMQGQSPISEQRQLYREYLLWLQTNESQHAEEYWRSYLAGIYDPTPLGSEQRSVRASEPCYAREEVKFSVETSQQWQAHLRQQHITLNTLLQSAWALVLSQHSGREEVIFGGVVAGRPPQVAGIERMLGLFINTLPVRIGIKTDWTVREWLQDIQAQQIDQQHYATTPLTIIKRCSEIAGTASLFDSVLVVENYPVEAGLRDTQHGLQVEDVQIYEQTNYPLTIIATNDVQLRLRADYDETQLGTATVQLLLQHLQTALAQLVQHPERLVQSITLVNSEERTRLLRTWNTTAVDWPTSTTLSQLFEQQVEQTPEAVALVYADEQITYEELNYRANQLAHHLQTLGVGPDVLVGICMERSFEVLIGLLAILKAGGAYVPLDPSYPVARLSFMAQQAQISLLLTQTSLLAHLPVETFPSEMAMLCLGQEFFIEELAQQPTDNPISNTKPDHLAYIIYTSGSTGQPKGVALSHRALSNLFRWQANDLPLEVGTRVLQFAPLSFDVSCEELFTTWQQGGTIVALPSDELRRDPEAVLDLLAQQSIARLYVPYVALQQFATIASQRPERALTLQAIITAGEQLQITSAITSWFQQLSQCRLYNYYGPSESHVVTTYPLQGEPQSWPTLPPIGCPIANTHIYLLNEEYQPVPIGVAGDLYIGGISLARGYLRRPDLTAERFVPDPFAMEPGSRLYQTGDLARYRNDGSIEFLGRRDQQVKLRGFRIEPGEIEATLQGHRAIKEAVVLIHEPQGATEQEHYLIAYVVTGETEMPAAQDLQRYLKQHLPDYMIPARFIQLDSFPLTPSGKINRRALPIPDEQALLDQQVQAVTPLTPHQELLVQIWIELLHLSQIGLHDNFFLLGGHSLLATQVQSRIRQVFQIEMPIHDLFEYPTIATLAHHIEQRRQEGRQRSIPALEPMPRPEAIPLSFAQERLWFLQQLEPANTAYHLPAALRLRGPLQVQALERSLQELQRRHEALRTTFSTLKGQPIQVIGAAAPIQIPVIDLRAIAVTAREQTVQRLVQQEARTRFDLASGPLLRVRVLCLDNQTHVLLVTMHHIIADGWSISVLIRELSALYHAAISGERISLPALSIQYADYALWQRSWLQGELLETQLAYWKTQLVNAPALLELPTDRSRPAIQTFAGARHSVLLSAKLQQQLIALSQSEGVTLFMTLLATFQILLMRYSGQEDIVVGSPIANRSVPELENLLGVFINTLVLRTDLSGHPSFRQVLARVRDVTLGAYAHQDLPFEELVDGLQVERSLSYSPLFQVMFILQNTPQEAIILDDLSWQPIENTESSARFDLMVEVQEQSNGLLTTIEYNTDLFDDATIARMLSHWQILLQDCVTTPERSISDLALLSTAEITWLVETLNNTSQPGWQSTTTLPQLIEQQVSRNPDTIAVVFENQHLTYQELNARANRLAHRLQQLGVEPEIRVGIYLHRSLEMVIGLLGILKAGGTYVPLNPAYPAERLAFLINDSQVALLLTEPTNNDLPPALSHVPTLSLDWQHMTQESEDNPQNTLMPRNLAYLIYTSGSTGQPKGVAITHHSAVTMINWALSEFTSEELSGVLASTATTFDLSVFELFVPLSGGGTVIMVENALALPTLPMRERVTLLNTVPSVATELVRTHAIPKTVRTVNLAGEALHATLVQQLYQQETIQRVLNLYGPSEDTTYSTYMVIEQEEQTPTIGRPIDQTQAYILDASMHLVPMGVVGELYLGGDGLARGYLNRPELTAERFMPHPFSTIPGERLYRTGDLVRYRPDNTIEYLGRADFQVKLRGFRIELGEIEAILQTHTEVREAAVIAQEVSETGQQLIAYVAAQPGTITEPDLQQFLQSRLPAYMVPTIFIWLDALPLTPHGKLDRRALPIPEQKQLSDDSVVGPRTPLEEMIGLIWANLLHRSLSQISIHDNFFLLGGHSLLAIQVQARIRQVCQIELSVRDLFEAPTIALLTQRIMQLQQQESQQALPALIPLPRNEALPLSFAQERLWFLQQLEPLSAAYHLPAVLQLCGPLQIAALQQSLQALQQRHEILRTSFKVGEGRPIQVIVPSYPVSLPVIDLRGLDDSVRESIMLWLAQQETLALFDLATGPLLRVKILRLDGLTHIVLVTMHHIISDGWSMSVLIRELSALYHAEVAGETVALPALPIQYADYTLWQRAWLQDAVLETQLQYWRTQLAGAPALLELPTDRPRPAVQTFVGARQSRILPAALQQALNTFSQREGVTLFMTLLAAFQLLLMRYSGQEDIVVGSPIANRTRQDLEGLIGMFVNTLVLRTDLSGNPGFRELLERVREVMLGAYAHQDLPFEKLVDGLQIKRSLSYSPLFQVMFVLQNTPQEAITLDGLSWHPISIDNLNARFDLTVELQETADGLLTTVEYNTDLFDATTITRLLAHWQTLLQECVTRPTSAISALSLLPAAEQSMLIDRQPVVMLDDCSYTLPELIEQQIERTPDAIALVYNDQFLTYRELNAHANQVAHLLRQHGIGPDQPVALYVERSLHTLIGMLGILKAGGTYIPLDPSFPPERLQFMLEDAHPHVLLTQQSLVQTIRSQTGETICLDSDWPLIAQQSTNNPERWNTPAHLAYLLYTSGSTGKPKGVMIPHRALSNFLRSMQDQFSLASTDTIGAITTTSFDIAGLEIYLPLLMGARVVLIGRDDAINGEQLTQLLTEQSITFMQATPATWQMLCEAGWSNKQRNLTTILCGGEAWSSTLAERLLQTRANIWNMYGPTETTIWSSMQQVIDASVIHLGTPITNTDLYVLDPFMNLVPIGIAGELYIGGAGLARGYTNRADLTAERFVPHPFSSAPGARLYRTGDRVRFRADGTLEYLGRMDFQVKLRGFRIELGEIEAALRQQTGVQDAVVTLQHSTNNEQEEHTYLLAYLVPQADITLQIAEIEAGLQAQLPAYMVPHAFMLLETLPITPNGKLDRRALPLPDDQTIMHRHEQFVAPSTSTQEILAQIWIDLLHLPQVGIHDNFFALGGHSLLATQLMTQVSTNFQVEIPIRRLFEMQTIAEMAQVIDELQITAIHEIENDDLELLLQELELED